MEYKETLEIGGKEYTFAANRKARVVFNNLIQKKYASERLNAAQAISNVSTEEILTLTTCALLSEHHKLSLEETAKLRDLASSEEEYGDSFDEFINKLFEKTVVVGKKTIDFLGQKG